MPYFHATRDRLIPSIRQHGLGGALVEQNFPGCLPGVYLADSPEMALMFLLEAVTDGTNRAITPKDEISTWVVIVVDDARVNPGKLRLDPQVELPGIWLYDGIIDVRNAVVVQVDNLL